MGSERVCFHGRGRAKLSGASSGFKETWASFQGGLTRTWGEKDDWVLRGFVFMAWGERSSLMLPLGFHCSAAVWCFSLLAAAALGASAAAGLVAPCWKFWSLAVACFSNIQKCSRFPFLAKTGFGGRLEIPSRRNAYYRFSESPAEIHKLSPSRKNAFYQICSNLPG